MIGRVVFVGLLVTLLVVPSACSFSDTSNSANPSYRMLTTQILEIDSALGTRGGLAALVRPPSAAYSPTSGMAMSGNTAPSTTTPVSTELSWNRITGKVKIIENAWQDIQLELEERKIESGPTWYLKYYRIMAVSESFQMSLAAVKLDVSTKQQQRIATSVTMLTDAFVEVKRELNIFVVDGKKLVISLVSFAAVLISLTVLTSLIARRRDRKLAKVAS